MIKRDYTILWALGIHARPSSTLVKCIGQFDLAKADMFYESPDGLRQGSMKSVLELLCICAPCQGIISVELSGTDEEKAAAFLQEFFSISDEEELYEKYNPEFAQRPVPGQEKI